MPTTVVSSLLALAVLAVALLVYRRTGRIEHQIREQRSAMRAELATAELRLYRQIEALLALREALGTPIPPLPPLRDWAGAPDFLLEVAREITLRRPETIVECSSGSSTVVAARCCQLNGVGHVYSLENAAEFAGRTRRLLEAAGLQDWATVVDAPLTSYAFEGQHYTWYSIEGLNAGSIDMLVVDGPLGKLNEQARYPAGPLLIPRMSERAIVMLDDAERPDERRIVERWSGEFTGFRREDRIAEKGLAVLARP